MSSALGEISKAVSDVAAMAAASVVGIGRAGSGVVIGDGLVLTNAHNLRGPVNVTFADGRSAEGQLTGADIDGDLAVLSVPTAGVPGIEWPSAGGEPPVGALVIALSRPRGGALRAGVGFVSGTGLAFRGPEGRTVHGAIEHSAQLPHGASGGPLLDAEGRLVGLNTHRPGDGSYLAIPAGPDLKARVDALAQGQSPRRARLGVALAPPKVARHLRRAVGLPDRDGLLVHDISPDGPAGRSGLRQGDLIVAVDDNPVATVDDLAHALDGAIDRGSVRLVVVRGVEEVLVDVSFGTAGAGGGEEGTA